MIPGLLLLIPGLVLGQTGMIAYISGQTQSDYQLKILNLDTGETVALGQGDIDAYPRWAPDGRRIAYQSKQPDGTGIRIAYPHESRDEGVEHRFSWNYRPAWSPCGQFLSYSADGDSAPLQSVLVYSFETGQETIWGGDQRGLMFPIWLPTTDLMKALDPDDQSAAEALGLFELKAEAEASGVIAAIGLTGAPPRIGTEVFILTPSLAVPLLPFLVPDSRRYIKHNVQPDHAARQIAFESNEGGDREIFVLGRRGITNITNHPAADWNPVWSPDNNWLAFESFRDGRRGLFRVLASTANVSAVVVGDNYDCWSPDWSPDGRWIVFVSDMTGTPQLHLVQPDGSGLAQLTHGEGAALAPAWQPTPRKGQE